MGKNNGIMNFKGTEYYTVARRVDDFRAAHPIAAGWGIVTRIVSIDEKVIIVEASITDPEGRLVARDFAEEVRTSRGVNSTSALENACTSAIGRALAAAGYGGGGAYASADELASALHQQNTRRGPVEASRADEVSGLAAAVESMGLTIDEVNDYARRKGWGLPGSWPVDERAAFVEDLAAGKHPALYKPPRE